MGFELKLLRLQHFRAQPRPDKLFRRHAVVGDEPQHGKGGRPKMHIQDRVSTPK